MNMLLAVGVGGGLGAMARYLVGSFLGRLLGSGFPYATLFVNVSGSLVMGLLVEILALKFSISPVWRAFLAVGVLGGYTTFSSYSLEVALLIERNTYGLAALYAMGSVALSVGGLFAGMYIGRMVTA